MTRTRFLYNLSHASFRKEWGADYRKPGLGARFITFLIRILPKFGPLKTLRFKTPTPKVERLFMSSFNDTLSSYREFLAALRTGQLQLPDSNLDLGEPTRPGAYPLCDRAYAELLDKLRGHYNGAPVELRVNILAFYADLNAPIATKTDRKAWARVLQELDELKASNPAAKL